MHSDIDTIERIKILSSLIEDKFDVLVGINLLREGLDLPEVSLIVVLDADKEGFLRSKTSLLQVAGRAARNINGKAILYGDRITNSMQYAINETERRRSTQEEYNREHSIVPKGIKKNITDVMEGAHKDKKMGRGRLKNKDKINLETFSPELILKKIKILEKKMYQHARDLEFEEAAGLRDQIESFQNDYLGFDRSNVG